ncbi:MAG: V-type ATP synthase subunit F [Actinobacteria bacterium]|nr:V-type ATP synthase subunit F [Actinomycetota bacterium]
MSEVAVIGDKNSIVGFSALGLKTYFADESEDVREIWSKIEKSGHSLVFVTEPVYLKINDLISDDSVAPIVLVIPAASGSTGVGRSLLKRVVEKAVGVDILSKDEES